MSSHAPDGSRSRFVGDAPPPPFPYGNPSRGPNELATSPGSTSPFVQENDTQIPSSPAWTPATNAFHSAAGTRGLDTYIDPYIQANLNLMQDQYLSQQWHEPVVYSFSDQHAAMLSHEPLGIATGVLPPQSSVSKIWSNAPYENMNGTRRATTAPVIAHPTRAMENELVEYRLNKPEAKVGQDVVKLSIAQQARAESKQACKHQCDEENCRRRGPNNTPPVFGTKNDLERHTKEVHKKEMDGTPVVQQYCPHPDCRRHTRSFSRPQNVKEHIRKVHHGRLPPVTDIFIPEPPHDRSSWADTAIDPHINEQRNETLRGFDQQSFMLRGEHGAMNELTFLRGLLASYPALIRTRTAALAEVESQVQKDTIRLKSLEADRQTKERLRRNFTCRFQQEKAQSADSTDAEYLISLAEQDYNKRVEQYERAAHEAKLRVDDRDNISTELSLLKELVRCCRARISLVEPSQGGRGT